ncbi:hypothetical protein SDC9_148407 [bioreactor metagenome]|uniref:Uncharacterized protein n=1 Tax=bioreactor metagenome TaxID=1076179 RepID=A0A645EH03_9ZZZZ
MLWMKFYRKFAVKRIVILELFSHQGLEELLEVVIISKINIHGAKSEWERHCSVPRCFGTVLELIG